MIFQQKIKTITAALWTTIVASINGTLQVEEGILGVQKVLWLWLLKQEVKEATENQTMMILVKLHYDIWQWSPQNSFVLTQV